MIIFSRANLEYGLAYINCSQTILRNGHAYISCTISLAHINSLNFRKLNLTQKCCLLFEVSEVLVVLRNLTNFFNQGEKIVVAKWSPILVFFLVLIT